MLSFAGPWIALERGTANDREHMVEVMDRYQYELEYGIDEPFTATVSCHSSQCDNKDAHKVTVSWPGQEFLCHRCGKRMY